MLFDFAEEAGAIFALEKVCREAAIQGFAGRGQAGRLFCNVHPRTLLDPAFTPGETRRLLDKYGMVTLVFDDGLSSVYQYAFPVLSRYGLPATVGIIANRVDSGDADFMRRSSCRRTGRAVKAVFRRVREPTPGGKGSGGERRKGHTVTVAGGAGIC